MLRRFRSILAHDGVEHAFAERLTFHILVIAFENIGLMNRTAIHAGDADARLQFSALIGCSALDHLIADLQAFLFHRIVTGGKKQSEYCKNENSCHRCMFFRPSPRTRKFPGLGDRAGTIEAGAQRRTGCGGAESSVGKTTARFRNRAT